jgi:hypothetical protein
MTAAAKKRLVSVLSLVALCGSIIGGGSSFVWSQVVKPKIETVTQTKIDTAFSKHEELQASQFRELKAELKDQNEKIYKLLLTIAEKGK